MSIHIFTETGGKYIKAFTYKTHIHKLRTSWEVFTLMRPTQATTAIVSPKRNTLPAWRETILAYPAYQDATRCHFPVPHITHDRQNEGYGRDREVGGGGVYS